MRNIACVKSGKLTMKTIECRRASEDAPRLSAHEMAALLLLRHAPIDVTMGNPDVMALQNAGLADLIESEMGKFKFAITSRGNAVLRAFGVLNDSMDKVRPLFRF
jgi:hypothetical protein